MSISFGSITSSTNYTSSIDKASIASTINQIIGKSVDNATISQIDASKFARPDVGINLYSSNSQLQKQVSLTSNGQNILLNNATITNVQFLNSQAAINSAYNINKSIDGKIAFNSEDFSSNNLNLKDILNMPEKSNILSTNKVSKDKKGSSSNPFIFDREKQGENHEKEEKRQAQPLDIVA